ncbi:hypothetical protein ACFYZH_31915 [Streptomyces abikoensis]|uniref:hypothetical protein n=1 Tax=Streptomyces abikoensis TaxID=97398 RepID=UPI003695A15A
MPALTDQTTTPFATLLRLAAQDAKDRAAKEFARCEEAVRQAEQRRRDQRDRAVDQAVETVALIYTSTLQRVLDKDVWTGYPCADEDGRERGPLAVASLADGAWAVHERRALDEEYEYDEVTLLLPCHCGIGYLEHAVRDDGDLLITLDSYRTRDDRMCAAGLCSPRRR